tara:strand:- start:359 stop:1102 length:744 start_codon:yes stop_codon:yes gene_type:complete
MASYFSYFPNIEYVSRTTDRSSAEEYITVKNIFRRAKIRNDFYNVATAFEDYMIIANERPDQVAEAVYGDPRYDWVILTANNITNMREQWPLNAQDFQNYILEKYKTESALEEIHHYITEISIDSRKRIVVPEGLRVDSNFNSQYLDQSTRVEIDYGGTLNDIATVDNVGTVRDSNGNIVTHDNILAVTNYEYEENLNDGKRRIKILKEDYLNVVINDMRTIMKYKPSSQYIDRGLKQAYNPRLSGA